MRDFIQANVEANVNAKGRAQQMSNPRGNYVITCAEARSGSLLDGSMMSQAMLRWVAMPSSRTLRLFLLNIYLFGD
jgi:hypothetical protein